MKPAIGDEIFMKIMGGDVYIEVTAVSDQQPLYETDGVYIVTDQYGEDHLVEMDGNDWVVAAEDSLSVEGWEALEALRCAKPQPQTMG